MSFRPTRPSRTTLSLVASFVLVSLLVLLGTTNVWDDELLHWVEAHRTGSLTNAMLFVTLLGNGAIEIPFALGAATLLWVRGHAPIAKRYVFAAACCELVYVILKPSFHRERPSIIPRLGDAGWYSYPSGHAMLAPVMWSLGLLLLAATTTRKAARIPLAALAVLLPPAIAASRVYLGVHYPSDVLAGLLLGSGWALWWWPVSLDAESSPDTSSPASIR